MKALWFVVVERGMMYVYRTKKRYIKTERQGGETCVFVSSDAVVFESLPCEGKMLEGECDEGEAINEVKKRRHADKIRVDY